EAARRPPAEVQRVEGPPVSGHAHLGGEGAGVAAHELVTARHDREVAVRAGSGTERDVDAGGGGRGGGVGEFRGGGPDGGGVSGRHAGPRRTPPGEPPPSRPSSSAACLPSGARGASSCGSRHRRSTWRARPCAAP